jgi:hypothetical protein
VGGLFPQVGSGLSDPRLAQRTRLEAFQIEKQLDHPDVVETFKVRTRKCATYLYDAARVQVAEKVANA